MNPKKPWYGDWKSLGVVVLGVMVVGGISQITSTPSTSSSATQPAAVEVSLPDVQSASEVGGVTAPIIQAAPAPAPAPAPTPARVAPAPVIAKPTPAHKETLLVEEEPTKQACNQNYSGCLNPNASDYDCAGGSGNGPYYTGRVQVLGYDEYDLDRDNDGWGCE